MTTPEQTPASTGPPKKERRPCRAALSGAETTSQYPRKPGFQAILAQRVGGVVDIGDLMPPPTPKTRATVEARCKKCHFYKPLPKEFRRDGFTYRQIARERDAAIYEQRWTGCAEPTVSYEVIRIRRREGFEIHGRFVEPAEAYPNSEAWGFDGFTLVNREAVLAKFRSFSTPSTRAR
jgi:hypothetical protein